MYGEAGDRILNSNLLSIEINFLREAKIKKKRLVVEILL
jgi:hypothetical protein